MKRIIGVGALVFVVVSFIAMYKIVQRQHELRDYIDILQQERMTVSQAAPVKVVETVIKREQPWGALQPKLRNAVAQVFSQIAEFDWLQPYKTPRQSQANGSAFFINPEGELISNAHVVDQAKSIFIQIPSLGKQMIDVQVIGVSKERDIALLRVKPDGLKKIKQVLGAVPYLTFGDSDAVRRADEIMALGYPLGQQSLKSTTGVVSGSEKHMIQISAPINPGNSGGPAINIDGQVIGINTAGVLTAQNVGYIVPINEVKIILDDLHKVKLLRKPYLGIFFNPAANGQLTQYLGNPEPGGCYVVELLENSPLAKAGVKGGDMIYSINGHQVDVYGEMNVPWSEDKISLIDYISRLVLGQDVHLVVYRSGKKKEFAVKFSQCELPPVRTKYPEYENIDYEVIGGMVIMEMALNHIPLLVQVASNSSAAAMLKYEDPKTHLKPVLIITHILPDSQAQRSRSLHPAMMISEINGRKVTTLQELRQAFKDGFESGYLTVKTTENILVALPFGAVLADEQRLSADYKYPISDAVQQLISKYTQMNGQDKAA